MLKAYLIGASTDRILLPSQTCCPKRNKTVINDSDFCSALRDLFSPVDYHYVQA